MKNYLRLILLFLLVGVFSTIWVLSQPNKQKLFWGIQQEKMSTIPDQPIQSEKVDSESNQKNDLGEFEKDLKRVEKASASRSLEALWQLSNEFQRKWRTDVRGYTFLQKEIINSLSSYDFQDKRQYLYTVKIAKDVLKNADNIPVNLEFEFISKLKSSSVSFWKVISEKDWKTDREERVKLITHFWNRFQNKIDRNFNFNDIKNRPVGNVPVPAPNYLPGIEPDDIKEPEIRAKYMTAIEANKAKAETYNLQIELHRLDKELPDFIEKFFIELYSQPPDERQVLEKNLRLFNIADDRKEKILEVVAKSLSY